MGSNSRFSEWNQFDKHVQPGLTDGQFLNASSILVCAGPPFLDSSGFSPSDGEGSTGTSGDTVFPIGLLSNFGLQQRLSIIPIPEIGSYRKYSVTGPSDGSFSASRILYHGPSVLRAMYAYYSAQDPSGEIIDPLVGDASANLNRFPKNKINDSPGKENFYMNLASDLFTQPVGLLLYFQDVNKESYGAVYLEQVQVASHAISASPGQQVLSENINCMFSRVRPVKLANTIPLMSRASDSEHITTGGTIRGNDGELLGTKLHIPTATNR